MSATVIIPTTGSPELALAVESVLMQNIPDVTCYVVVDGSDNWEKTFNVLLNADLLKEEYSNLKISQLPINVGANGFYGHRVYAAFTHLVNSKYVLYLDQDNWLDHDHVRTCIQTIESQDLDWCYSLRKIYDKDKHFLIEDNCESLGKWPVFSNDYSHIDTNCYCLKTSIATKISSVWHGGWGQDRVFFSIIGNAFKKYDTTGKYTLNYRVGGNEGSVKKEFFEYGNKVMSERYNGVFPWRKEI